jgi:hypothetical protein
MEQCYRDNVFSIACFPSLKLDGTVKILAHHKGRGERKGNISKILLFSLPYFVPFANLR